MDTIYQDQNEYREKTYRAKYGFLRSQVNPHFLFNTLSLIKFSVRNDPDAAEEAIYKLSDLLSYSTSNSVEKFVSLEIELEQIRNLIDLQKMRFDNKQNVSFKIVSDKDYTGLQIVPLVLISIIENLYRHGSLLQNSIQAEILLNIQDEHLTFSTTNLISKSTMSEPSTNTLELTRQRLEEYYDNEFIFKYGLEDNIFSVFLKLPTCYRT